MDTYLTQFQNAQMKAILRPGSRVPFETFISDQCSEAESMFYLMKHKDPESLALKTEGVLDIEDDPAWHSAETGSDNTGATSNFKVGVDCLGRFSVALGGKCIAHTAKEQLSAYLVAPQWEKHHAALNALACIAKGCSKLVMFKNLKQPVNMALSCFQDPHPRVRLAACEAIQNLSTVYCPDYREQYHNQAVPALAATLDYSHPRVQASAALALWKFCECNKPETLKPYLDELVNKLLVLIQNSKLMVQEAALRALSRLSLSVKGHFWTYYDTVMPHLKAVLRNADLKSNHRLHGLALQCISFVGSAGGKEKFREDAEQTCGNICTCLGRDFLPYTSEVMPFFIIQCAQLEPVSICLILCCYADKLEEDFYPWIPQEVTGSSRGNSILQKYSVRKTAVEAMYNLLYSAKLAVEKGIAQGGSGGTGAICGGTGTIGGGVTTGDVGGGAATGAVGGEVGVVEEDEWEIVTECPKDKTVSVICFFFHICGPLVNEGQLHRIVDEVKHVITESSNRNGKLKERAKSEDFDAEEDELLRGVKEQEDNIFVQLRRILKTLIKTFKAAFLPFFDELSSYLIPMWGKENTAQKRCTPIDIFASLVMECPEVTLKWVCVYEFFLNGWVHRFDKNYFLCLTRYCDVFLPLFLDASNDEHPTVRQRALYGLELYAEYGGAVFKHFVTEAVSRINVVIMHFRAREPENENVYYSAVFALGKICQFHWESIGSAQVVPFWLNCLPIKGDLDEAKYVHDLLCSMVERALEYSLSFAVVHLNFLEKREIQHLLEKEVELYHVQVPRSLVLCSEKALATKKTANNMINVLRHLQKTLPPAMWESAWSYLCLGRLMELKSILSPKKAVKTACCRNTG
uniref:Importin-5-like n=1 Tax=Nicotiana tabacum TaxID=4097 RepID=A0A1S4A6A9_TOBAC|nr:PREDICTED: importin-5-like [Nicotiana tabacum]